jgi:signal transduction histidine kinase/integral membrane sensor domain MASE1
MFAAAEPALLMQTSPHSYAYGSTWERSGAERRVNFNSGMRNRLVAAGIAVAAASGYYLGSVLGLLLRLPPATPSVIWPPNSILTAILLLVPTQRWPLVLLSALPVHLWVELNTPGWPLMMVVSLFVTNSCEAILVAGGLRLLSDAPTRFDTPRRLSILFIVIVSAIVLSSFADAAAVNWFVGEPYWTVWRNRLFSNILAQLTFVPAIVGVATGLPRWIRNTSVPHAAEATVLAAGLLVMGLSDFTNQLTRFPPMLAVSTQNPLALQLPFLLWAAVRFGSTGAGVTLLTTTLLAVWSSVHGRGPFALMSPSTSGPALTLSLIVVVATVQSLAALIQERRDTQQALAGRLRFEELLSRMSGAFVHVPSDRMDAGFDEWLARLGLFLDLSCVRLYSQTAGDLKLSYGWSSREYESQPVPVVRRDYPWTWERLRRLEPVVVPSIDRLPPEASMDRRSMQAAKYKAQLVLPLVAGHRALGALSFAASSERAWSEDTVRNLRLVAEVLANALARKQTEDALRASEGIKSSILQSLSSGVVVVDSGGQVLALNDGWSRLAKEGGGLDVHVGENLLDATRAAASVVNARIADVSAAISSVLDRSRDRSVLEYTSHSGPEPRWWSVLVVPLHRPEGGAVVTLTDVTGLRRAELDVQRSRQELAHVGRVSTVGELTASLAHELNQPLAAIMTNAQTAGRLLGAMPPDLPQVRTILADIVKDDRRASDVIKRLRDLLRKGKLEMARVDLAATIRDVVDLLSSEAIIKHIRVFLDLDRDRVLVLGDKVQLQQVMLNLLHNAMEAIGDREGRVFVRCRSSNGNVARVTVTDTGPGFDEGAEELVFEPFYTTKREGMGMGLSIVRTILESHGGTIKAMNNGRQGALFEFTLPLANDSDS